MTPAEEKRLRGVLDDIATSLRWIVFLLSSIASAVLVIMFAVTAK